MSEFRCHIWEERRRYSISPELFFFFSNVSSVGGRYIAIKLELELSTDTYNERTWERQPEGHRLVRNRAVGVFCCTKDSDCECLHEYVRTLCNDSIRSGTGRHHTGLFQWDICFIHKWASGASRWVGHLATMIRRLNILIPLVRLHGRHCTLTILVMRILRFPHRSNWQFRSPVIWRWVVGWVVKKATAIAKCTHHKRNLSISEQATFCCSDAHHINSQRINSPLLSGAQLHHIRLTLRAAHPVNFGYHLVCD